MHLTNHDLIQVLRVFVDEVDAGLDKGVLPNFAVWRWARTSGNSANTNSIGQASDEKSYPCNKQTKNALTNALNESGELWYNIGGNWGVTNPVHLT